MSYVERRLIKSEDIGANELQVVETYEVLNDTFSAAADSTGIKEPPQRIYLDAEDVKHLKDAYLDLSYAWAATADGTIQLYNVTDAAVAAESSTKTGGEASERERITVSTANLIAGKEYKIRVNITTAGAAGETATIRKATLKLIKRIS